MQREAIAGGALLFEGIWLSCSFSREGGTHAGLVPGTAGPAKHATDAKDPAGAKARERSSRCVDQRRRTSGAADCALLKADSRVPPSRETTRRLAA
jgi:hypothetical protein